MDAAALGRDDGAFRPWHLFLMCALLGATAAVALSADNSPSNLLLISAAIVSAGIVGVAFQRTLWPLVAAGADQTTAPVDTRARVALEREKLLVMRSIKELEFDRAMGKVADADFAEMVARLRARAIGLMKQLDEQGAGYRDAIERELRSRLHARGVASEAGRPQAGLSCAQCGTHNDVDARFCKSCGNRIGS